MELQSINIQTIGNMFAVWVVFFLRVGGRGISVRKNTNRKQKNTYSIFSYRSLYFLIYF